jgi:hypothetical protein
MAWFNTKCAIFGTFWKALGWKSVKYFVALWYSYCPFGILYNHLVFGGYFGIFFHLQFVVPGNFVGFPRE